MENNPPSLDELIDSVPRFKTIPKLSNFLNEVLGRNILISPNLQNDYAKGFNNGIKVTIEYVLKALEEIEEVN